MRELLALLQTQIAQIAVCVVVAGAAARLLKRRPAWALAIWLAVLVKCLAPPIWSSPVGLFSAFADGDREAPLVIDSQPIALHRAVQAFDMEAVPRTNRAPQAESRSPTPPSWEAVLVGLWLAGTATVLTIGIAQWRSWRRMVETARVHPPRELPGMVRLWAERMKMPAPRCLAVTETRLGPAASGFWRPTVVVPAFRDARLLEAALVHEMLHLRRRDQWTGALQLVVQALYWFHPFVWWANREASRWIEQTCDAATVAALRCAPREYADLLIRTLEHRVRHRSVPLAAGMSPARFASRRLEAVMMSNAPGAGRTGVSGWLLFVAAATLLIPGAAMKSDPPILAKAAQPAPAFAPHPLNTPVPDAGPLVYDGHRLDAAMDRLVKRHGLDEDAARDAILLHAIPGGKVAGEPVAFATAGRSLMTLATARQQSLIAGELDRIAKHGFDSIELCTDIWEISEDDFAKSPFGAELKTNAVGAFFSMRKDRRRLADEAFTKAPNANRLSAPKLVVLDGQEAFVSIGERHPIESPDGKFVDRSVFVGMSLSFAPKLAADGKSVDVAVRYEDTKLLRMSETSRVVDGRSRSFNVPITQQHVVATSVKIEEGVMVGIRMPSKGGHRIMMLEWELHRFGALPTAAPAVSGTAAFEDAKFNEKYRLARQGAKSTEPVAKVYPLDDLFGPSARSPRTTAAFAKALAAILPKTAGQFKPSPRGKANEEYDCAIMVNGDEDSHRNVVQILRGLRGGRAETKTAPAAN